MDGHSCIKITIAFPKILDTVVIYTKKFDQFLILVYALELDFLLNGVQNHHLIYISGAGEQCGEPL